MYLKYEQDFYGWIQQNIEFLKQGKFSEIDVTNLVEELDSMGKSEKRELGHRLEILLAHLLKWQFQSGHRSHSWRSTIDEQRRRISEVLEDSPSLRPLFNDTLNKVYPYAVKLATNETGLPKTSFPVTCPYTIEQLLTEDYYPET